MAVFFGMIVIGLFMWGILRAASSGAGSVGGGRSYNWLTTRGTPARGILLQVESYGLPIEGLRAFGVERRNVTIDVEIPGRPPYTATASVYVQRNLTRDVLPGATVELRVDPNRQTAIAIVGPGTGFVSSALRAS